MNDHEGSLMNAPAETPNFEVKSLRQVLDAGIPLARKNIRALYWPIALPVVIISTISGVVQAGLMARVMPTASEEMDLSSFLDLMSLSAGAIVIGLFAMAVMVAGYSALTVTTMDVLGGRQPDMKRAWGMACQPGMLWTAALTVIFSILSLLLCLLPALWMLPLLTLTLPVAVVEGSRGMGAVSRGATLLRSRPGMPASERPWVRSLVVLLVAAALVQALTWVGQGPLLIVQQIWIARDMASGDISNATVWLQVPLSAIGALTQVLAWVYATFTLGVHYHDVINRRRGADLEQEIDRWASRGDTDSVVSSSADTEGGSWAPST